MEDGEIEESRMINNRSARWAASVMNHIYSPAEPLSAIQKAVLICHMIYADWRSCSSYPGTARISKDTGYSERAVIEAQKRLCEVQILTLVRKGCRGDGKGRGRLANVYRVNIPQELIPPRFRTNMNEVHERNAMTNMNETPTNVNETPDQHEPRSYQVSYIQDSYKQDNKQRVTPDGDSALFFEEENLRSKANNLNVKTEEIEDAIANEKPERVQEILADLEAWPKLNRENASKAFNKIRKTKAKQKYPPPPFDGDGLAAYAREWDMPGAKPGEEALEYRARLLIEIRERTNAEND